MLSAADNELITRTGPGTPAGELFRRYWQPAALSEEVPHDGPPRPVEIMSERLVAFRDVHGQPGLLGRLCSHRAADLSYARVERDGLRCPYHGWLFNVNGRCLEMPAEPPDSDFHQKVQHLAYPCKEVNGIIWTYMGPGEPPPLPAFDWLLAPDDFIFTFKGRMECNYLQANEGEIDPSHLSFLHRLIEDRVPDGSYGDQLLVEAGEENQDRAVSRILREDVCPRIDIEQTDFGVRIFTVRDIDPARCHVRVTNYLFPNAAVVAVSNDWGLVQWHVPIDDCSNWRYDIFYSFREPMDREGLRRQRLQSYTLPDYLPRRNRANRYGYDFEEQQRHTYIGVGFDINTHDTWATEGPGPIQDRTREHLGTTDKAIIAARRMILRSINALRDGAAPPMLAPDQLGQRYEHLATIDTVASRDEWRTAWRNRDAARRQQSPWAAHYAQTR